MKTYLYLLAASVVLVSCTTTQTSTEPSKRTPAGTLDFKTLETLSRGAIEDCLMAPFLYARDGELATECTLNYVHFYPSAPVAVETPPAQLKIGSFNMYHLGDSQALMKNMEIVSKIINQWDVVGAQELMPLPTEYSK
ncbi:MAG: hypothetical protein V4692_07620, partial [Bdellovibrionota bacterium]